MYKSLMPSLIGIEADLGRSIELAQHHGYEGVDARMNSVADLIEEQSLDWLRDEFEKASVRPGYCSVLPGRVSVDESEWQQGVDQLPSLAKLAQALGYSRAVTVVLPFHEMLTFDENFDLHVKRLKQVAPILADHGISLGLEYVSPKTRRAGYEHPFIYDMKGMLKLCEATGAQNIGLLLDSFHWYCAGESTTDITRLKQEQVVVVHANDAIAERSIEEQVAFERDLPGASGVIDLAGFFKALQHINYDGPVTCEPMNKVLNNMEDDEAAALVSEALNRVMPPGTN
jgi:sugar phosphate isomerase/epimerase